jgi:hypothetical protein
MPSALPPLRRAFRDDAVFRFREYQADGQVASDASRHHAQEGDGDTYGGVEDYDPVLRSHCRLDEA